MVQHYTWYSVSAHSIALLFIEKFVQCYNESLHQPKCLFFKLFLQEIQLEKANSKNFTLISKTKESSKMTRGEK